jgi:UDP-N-acetyl-D-mannosaminuronic acid dehydrogenase
MISEKVLHCMKAYDPMVGCDIVKNQYHNFDNFLADVDLIVIMVAHDEIKKQLNKLDKKIVLDTRNICNFDGVYKL